MECDMTKKDYEKFAVLLKNSAPTEDCKLHGLIMYEAQIEHHIKLIFKISDLFLQDNPNFNRDKFINRILSQ